MQQHGVGNRLEPRMLALTTLFIIVMLGTINAVYQVK